MDIAELKESFEYSETSDSCLIYKIKTRNNIRNPGDKAGLKTFKSDGTPICWSLLLNRKRLSVHRIIWMLFYGEIPDNRIIDHIDGNPFNNKLQNLRLATYLDNNKNKKLNKNNKTSHCGVFYEKQTKAFGKVYEYYVAFYTPDYQKEVRKRFSINKLGEVEALEQALKFREENIKKVGGYTKRHGKEQYE